MKRLGPARAVPDPALVEAYAALLDSGPDSPAPSRWVSTDEMRIHATIAEGQSLTVLESYRSCVASVFAGEPACHRKGRPRVHAD